MRILRDTQSQHVRVLGLLALATSCIAQSQGQKDPAVASNVKSAANKGTLHESTYVKPQMKSINRNNSCSSCRS
jgi:hypothetical protein